MSARTEFEVVLTTSSSATASLEIAGRLGMTDVTIFLINETIDGTVFDRWRADPTYRPPNLVDWAKRKQVDPGELKASVRADDPHVDVPNL